MRGPLTQQLLEEGGAEDKVDGPCMVPRLQGTWGGQVTLLLLGR